MSTESRILPALRSVSNGVTLAVRAQPGARKTAVAGVYGDGPATQLKITVQSPPIEGRANAALITFLAGLFNLPKSKVELVTGELSRSKVFLLHGVTVPEAQARLSEPIQ
jgi:uncharacterized protein (TIGR00251 family)